MAKSTKDAYRAVSSFTGIRIAPEDLTIIGLDCPEDVCPELADPDRIDAPLDSLVVSIREHGVRQPIQVRKVSDLVVVVNGRQRVMAARLANRQIKAEKGDVQILVPCTVDGQPGASDSAVTSVITNEHTRTDSVLARARKAQRMLSMGHTLAATAAMFGVTRQTVANWRSLLSLSPEILAMVESGDLSATTAFMLASLPESERAKALADALASEGEDGGAVRERVKSGKSPGKGSKTWSVRQMRDALSRLDPDGNAGGEDPTEAQRLAHALLSVICGEDPSGEALADWPELHNAL